MKRYVANTIHETKLIKHNIKAFVYKALAMEFCGHQSVISQLKPVTPKKLLLQEADSRIRLSSPHIKLSAARSCHLQEAFISSHKAVNSKKLFFHGLQEDFISPHKAATSMRLSHEIVISTEKNTHLKSTYDL